MQVTVRVNGILAQKIGINRFPMALPDQATARALQQGLQGQYPNLSAEIERAVIVIGGTHRPGDTVLQDGQEVALLMPVAGGCA